MNGKKKGFTLIELLVVVLIIGILAAIALPQYQKAVLKSRYTTLMPIAKGIAEGNEAYFMEHGVYADDPTELPIKGQESYPDGTTLDLQDTDEYTYVLASRADLPGLHHIIYQHHSKNFPSETHCEAAKDNKLANWVCKDAFKGTKITGSLNSGYYSYVLEGSGSGTTATAAAVLAEKACPDGVDTDHCNTTVNTDGSTTKRECMDPSDTTTCTWTTIDAEGTQKAICSGETGTYDGSQCVPTEYGYAYHSGEPYEVTYDEDNNILEKKICGHYPPDGCSDRIFYTYHEDGSYDAKFLDCMPGTVANNGECTGRVAQVNDYTYDSFGNETSSRTCMDSATSQCETYSSGTDKKFDANGFQISSRTCASGSIPLEGNCTAYSAGSDHVRNEVGSPLRYRTCTSGSIPAEGSCTAYNAGTDFTYDGTRLISRRECVSGAVPSTGDCTVYKEGYHPIYNGNVQTSNTRIRCIGGSVDTSGNCSGTWKLSINDRNSTPCTGPIDWINVTCPTN